MSVYLVRSLLLSLFIAIFITVIYYILYDKVKSSQRTRFNKSEPTWSAVFTVKASRTLFAEQDKAFREAVKSNLVISGERFRSAGIEPEGQMINDSSYTISVKRITDTNAVRALMTTNSRISFNEVYTIDQLTAIVGPMSDLFKLLVPAEASITDEGRPQYPPYFGMCILENSEKVRSFFADEKILSQFPADIQFMFGEENMMASGTIFLCVYAIRKNVDPLSNKHIADILPEFDQITSEPILTLKFNASGTLRWERMTEKNVGRPIAICIDDKVIVAPNVLQKISGGNSIITTGNNIEATRILGVLLSSQELLLPTTITESRFTVNAPSMEAISSVTMYILAFCASFAISFCIIWFAFRPGKKSGTSPTDP